MSIDTDVTAIDVENAGDQRCAIKVLAPVLEQNVGLGLGQNIDPLPDSHPLFEMLLFNLTDGNGLDGPLDQVMTFLHNLFVATAHAGNLTRNGEFNFLRWIKWILQ